MTRIGPRRAFRNRAGDNGSEGLLELGAGVFAQASTNTRSVLEKQRSLHGAIRLDEAPGTRSAKPALETGCVILDVFQRSARSQLREAAPRAVPIGH